MRHHEIHSWSHHYREDRLAEASRIHLEGKLRAGRKGRERRNPLSALRNAIASLRTPSETSDSPTGELIA
jgi:hypothetical protein